jgi:hypothetical protein
MNFSVRSTDEEFLQFLREHIGAFRLDHEPDDHATFSANCGVTKRLGGKIARGRLTLYYGTTAIFQGRLYDEMAARLVDFVRELATKSSNQFVRVRAGAAALDGGALMMPSLPLGDEMVNLDPIQLEVHPLGLPLRLHPDDLELFPELDRRPSRSRRVLPPPRHLVRPDALGSSQAEPAPLKWIVFPSFDPGAETRLEPFGGSEAVFGLTQAVLNLHVWEDRAIVLIRRLIETYPVSRLVVGSLPDAAALLLETAPRYVGEVMA